MTDYLLVAEVKDFITELFHEIGASGIGDWKTLTPIEFGVLSWHLDNFYWCPLAWQT